MGLIGKKIMKKGLSNGKRIEWKKVLMSWKRNVYLCKWKRNENNSLEITKSFIRNISNVNLLFKKDFKSAQLLTKASFFIYFRDHPKNGEGNKGDFKSTCARVIKYTSIKVAKAVVNLNWLWTTNYGLFWLYIYIHGQFSVSETNAFTGSMVSLFFAASAPRVPRAGNLMRTSVQNGLMLFLLFGK